MEKEELIKKIMNCCFADDSIYKSEIKKNDYPEEIFWKNFRDWEKNSGRHDFSGIYNKKEYYTLRDPDTLSQKLYYMHEYIWNLRCNQYSIPQVKKVNDECKLIIDKENIILGSDSFISIYWHWRDMQLLLKEIAKFNYNNENLIENEIINMEKEIVKPRQEKCFYDENWDKIKRFIWLYLQKSNTIGGFIVFPRHETPTVNTKRGSSSKICDRFDLTLECIRRAYQYGDFYSEENNPLFGIPKEDKEFFKMFGSFENYIRFFCLEAWVNENYTTVNDLLSEDGKGSLPTKEWLATDNILPKTDKQWWTFYRNIMDRLDARNKQIEKLLSDCSEDDLQKLYNELKAD